LTQRSDSVTGGFGGLVARARTAYAARIAGEASAPWWTAVVITVSSARQAERLRDEIQHRLRHNRIPSGLPYWVVPDIGDQRMGSGGATINAISSIEKEIAGRPGVPPPETWWGSQRVLAIHAGGDSQKLPQYSTTGRLFSVLPGTTVSGETNCLLDEILALSTLWVEHVPSGLLVCAGDVILVLDSNGLNLARPGVSGVAVRQPAEMCGRHGVYFVDEQGRVYSYLQKPSEAQVEAAGGWLPNREVAVDSGLLRFDPGVCRRLGEVAASCGVGGREQGTDASLPCAGSSPRQALADTVVLDLYEHFTLALTGQWRPEPGGGGVFAELSRIFQATPFWCSLVKGDLAHIGTTTSLRHFLTESASINSVLDARQRFGWPAPPGVHCAGVILDSVLPEGSEVGAEAVVIDCDFEFPVHARRGAILHGLSGLPGPLEIPEDTVLHQVPVRLADGGAAVVIRAYGVADDPKQSAGGTSATWLGQPILERLGVLGLDVEAVWPGIPPSLRSLWNANLFPAGSVPEALAGTRWLLGYARDSSRRQWEELPRFSLATSTEAADQTAVVEAQSRRRQKTWRQAAVGLACAGADIRPLLTNAPGVGCLAAAGRALAALARTAAPQAPTQAASHCYQAALFLSRAGFIVDAGQVREAAFSFVRQAIDRGDYVNHFAGAVRNWRRQAVSVAAPARIDFGGGWSDTPPFCLDWGGTVLNMAVLLEGRHRIRASLKVLDRPVLRCLSEGTDEIAEYATAQEVCARPEPGSAFSIPRMAFQLAGIVRDGENLSRVLEAYGGGLEVRMAVDLPLGSGLGTSSILAAALIRGLAEMLDVPLSAHSLADLVLLLEQRMTTGGGWQDQVGGIFPGTKLTFSGPGLRQRLRVEPLAWSGEREADFRRRFLLYFTGLRRIAKDLLRQVVGSYLARETAAVQVLHSIKTLAMEMSHAMREGDWDSLGGLLDRHWELNQILDPNTTCAPITRFLQEVRPYVAGAKLAGAGGGGFLMMLARSPEAARALRQRVSRLETPLPGRFYEYQIAAEGLRLTEAGAGLER